MGITFFDFLRQRLNFDQLGTEPRRIGGLVRLVWQVKRERDKLASLTPRQLADIGIHPSVAAHEAKRELLDLPKARVDKVR